MRGSKQFQISLLTANVLLALSAWPVVALAAPLYPMTPETVDRLSIVLSTESDIEGSSKNDPIKAFSDTVASSTNNIVLAQGIGAYLPDIGIELLGGQASAKGSNIKATASSNTFTINESSILSSSFFATAGEVQLSSSDDVSVGVANKNQLIIKSSQLNAREISILGAWISAIEKVNGSISAEANENSVTFNGSNHYCPK